MNTQEQIERLRYLSQFLWTCPDPFCSGSPHAGYPNRHARPSQRVPGDAYIHAWITGRGFGKTRAAAEYVKARMLEDPGHRVNVVVPISSVGKLVVVEGESGMLAITPPDRIAGWSRSLGELTFKNGSQLKIFGAHSKDDAEAIRGSQSNTLWVEELATFRFQELAWNMAVLANRLPNAKVIVTSTPKSTPLIRKLFHMDNAKIVGGSTFENQENLAAEFIEHLIQSYQGTRLGQQELEGLLLNDVAGALFTREMIREADKAPDLARIVVAVDPPGGHRIGKNAKCGIVAVGRAEDGLLYVLADRSDFMTPEEWSRAAIDLYDELEADCIVAEVNYGGKMVESVLRTAASHPHFKLVHASRGKAMRAEPVVSLYEKKRVFHAGIFESLENQMTSWIPPGRVEVDSDGIESPIPASDFSPDAVDALVWAITELALTPKRRRATMHYTPPTPKSFGGVR